MSEKQTKAEIKARTMAQLFEEAGFKVEVRIERQDAVLFTDGDVMLPARVIAHVHANGANTWDDWYGFSFMTWLPAKGHRSSTRYIGGHLYRMSGSFRDKKLSLKQLRSRLGTEISLARYARTQEA
jgi:hypothetical protein